MFPSFTIEVNDSSDCIVSGGTADPSELVDFNAHVAGCVSAVSDNTRHRLSRRPSSICAPMTKRGSLKNVTFSADTVRPEETFSSSLVDSSLPTLACDADTTTILDSIPSLDSSPSLVDTSTSSENSTFFNTIGLNADDFTSSPLSRK